MAPKALLFTHVTFATICDLFKPQSSFMIYEYAQSIYKQIIFFWRYFRGDQELFKNHKSQKEKKQ